MTTVSSVSTTPAYTPPPPPPAPPPVAPPETTAAAPSTYNAVASISKPTVGGTVDVTA